MALRPTQNSIFHQVRSSIRTNLARLVRAQNQVSSGKRILAPSDDPVGISISMSLRRQMGGINAHLAAMEFARPTLSLGAARLQEASGLLHEARSLIVQGMNGTLSQSDRESVASQLELLQQSLLDIANSRSGERYLFAGTDTTTRPFDESVDAGRRVVTYQGNAETQRIPVGRRTTLAVNVPGSEVFGSSELTGVLFSGLTGVALGTSANAGDGYHEVSVRHDATTGSLGSGLALVAGGAGDTIIGDHALVVNAAARTVQLGAGAAVAIPTPLPTDLEVRDADGSLVHLDFSAWTGTDETTVLTGQGSIALDDGAFQAMSLAETDLELVDTARGVALHLDTTSITRAGSDVVTFQGTANLFDTTLGVVADLRNAEGLDQAELLDRINQRLAEFDRAQDDMLSAMGALGSRTARLDDTQERLLDLEVHLNGLLSRIEDADLTETVIEMNRAELTLQAAQATGARLLQQTLLNFLR